MPEHQLHPTRIEDACPASVAQQELDAQRLATHDLAGVGGPRKHQPVAHPAAHLGHAAAFHPLVVEHGAVVLVVEIGQLVPCALAKNVGALRAKLGVELVGRLASLATERSEIPQTVDVVALLRRDRGVFVVGADIGPAREEAVVVHADTLRTRGRQLR